MKITPQISEVAYSADQWGLYDLEGRYEAAVFLNTKFTEAVNSGKCRNEVECIMSIWFWGLRDIGAADTEGYDMLKRLLEKVYGSNHYISEQ